MAQRHRETFHEWTSVSDGVSIDCLIIYPHASINYQPVLRRLIDWLIDLLGLLRWASLNSHLRTKNPVLLFKLFSLQEHAKLSVKAWRKNEEIYHHTVRNFFYPDDDADQQKSVATKFPSGMNVMSIRGIKEILFSQASIYDDEGIRSRGALHGVSNEEIAACVSGYDGCVTGED